MKKILTISLLFLVTGICLVSALNWTPYGNIDLKDFYNMTNGVNGLFQNLTGNISWNNISDGSYPSACPTDTAVTAINDSTTCSAVNSLGFFETVGGVAQLKVPQDVNLSNNLVVSENLTVRNVTVIDDRFFVNMQPDDAAALSTEGSTGINGVLLVNDTTLIFSRPFGFGLAISDLEAGFIGRFSLGGTGSFNATTNFLCDTTNPFFANDTGNVIAILLSSPVNLPFVSEIISFINSTCVEVNPAAVPEANLTDLSVVLFGIAPAPRFYVLDNGVFVSNVGDTPGASFKINAPNSTGEDAVEIIQKSGTDDTHILHIESDAFNFSGITLIHTILKSTIAQTAADIMTFVVDADLSNFNNSDYNALEMNILSDGTSNTKTGIEFIGNWTRYIHSGSQEVINKTWYDNTTDLINTTDQFTSADDNIPIFEFDDSVIYIQNDINFTRIGVTLEVGASALGILPLFFYCNSTGEYESLTVTDGTSGFTSSGTISFTNPTNRGKCNQDINGVNFTDTANYSTVAIQRTANFIVTPPTESIFTITGEEEEFVLAEDFLQLKPISSPPGVCGASIESRAYYDLDINKWCYCDGSNFVQFDDSSTVCS